MSLINKKCPNCRHKLKMIDSYPTYHCDNCGDEYIMTGKNVSIIILFVSIGAIAITIVAFFLLEYLSKELNWEFSTVAAIYFLVMIPFALLLGWLTKKLAGNELSKKEQ
ncbi:MAG: hypothetical protein ACI4WG_07590 [Erysipelotrichaceae bacterium]